MAFLIECDVCSYRQRCDESSLQQATTLMSEHGWHYFRSDVLCCRFCHEVINSKVARLVEESVAECEEGSRGRS